MQRSSEHLCTFQSVSLYQIWKPCTLFKPTTRTLYAKNKWWKTTLYHQYQLLWFCIININHFLIILDQDNVFEKESAQRKNHFHCVEFIGGVKYKSYQRYVAAHDDKEI
eukprot:30599_1